MKLFKLRKRASSAGLLRDKLAENVYSTQMVRVDASGAGLNCRSDDNKTVYHVDFTTADLPTVRRVVTELEGLQQAELRASNAAAISPRADCDQCNAVMIQGVFCHETGCPNRSRPDALPRHTNKARAWVVPAHDVGVSTGDLARDAKDPRDIRS